MTEMDRLELLSIRTRGAESPLFNHYHYHLFTHYHCYHHDIILLLVLLMSPKQERIHNEW